MLFCLQCREPCATHGFLLHQIDEQDVGPVKIVVTRWRSGSFGLAAQLLVHAQPLGKNGAPRVGLVVDRFNLEANAAQQLGVPVDTD